MVNSLSKIKIGYNKYMVNDGQKYKLVMIKNMVNSLSKIKVGYDKKIWLMMDRNTSWLW